MAAAELRAAFAAQHQEHVFEYLDAGRVPEGEVAPFLAQLRGIDPLLVHELYSATMAAAAPAAAAAGGGGASPAAALSPCNDVTRPSEAGAAAVAGWRAAGLAAIAAGHAAALILAGGQGTRLGFDRPKGEYDLALPSGRTLFALQAERLNRLRALAAGPGGALPSLPLYIMTSPMTDADTRAYWAAERFFGLPPEDVMFFSQGTLPCLSPSGRILLEAAGRVAEAPDGNGGIYRALHVQGVVADMRRRGVRGVHAFAVDNAVVLPACPVFLGLCLASGADVGSKVCAKAGPHEKVGVLCKVGGQFSVVEYSEMDKATAELRGADGQLVYNTGNLCIHYYSVDFLEGPCSPAQLPKVYHLANKVREGRAPVTTPTHPSRAHTPHSFSHTRAPRPAPPRLAPRSPSPWWTPPLAAPWTRPPWRPTSRAPTTASSWSPSYLTCFPPRKPWRCWKSTAPRSFRP